MLFVALSLPIVIWLGVRSLNWLGPTRKWVAISLRLSVIWVLVLLLAGAQWVRQNRDLEVIVLRDVSTSTSNVTPPRGKTLTRAVDDLMQSDCKSKRPGDRIGVVGFSRDAQHRSTARRSPTPGFAPASPPAATAPTSPRRCDLAWPAFARMRCDRLVLVSDGNATQGDTDAAHLRRRIHEDPDRRAAAALRDSRDVLVDRLIAPTYKRLGEPFSVDVILRSTSVATVSRHIERHRKTICRSNRITSSFTRERTRFTSTFPHNSLAPACRIPSDVSDRIMHSTTLSPATTAPRRSPSSEAKARFSTSMACRL